MPILFSCASCGRSLRTPDGSEGKQAKCPDCGALTRIPSPLEAGAASGDLGKPEPSANSGLPSGATEPHIPLANASPFASTSGESLSPFADFAGPSPFAAKEANPYSAPSLSPIKDQPEARQDNRGQSKLVMTIGIISFVFGLFAMMGFCCCPISVGSAIIGFSCGVPAWIIGVQELRRYDAGLIAPFGREETRNGMIFGIVGTTLSALAMLGLAGWIAFAMLAESV